MGRKNSRVRHSNSRMSKNERRELAHLAKNRDRHQGRVEMKDLIVPDGKCSAHGARKPKARFATEAKANAALKQAQQQRARLGSSHVEKRYYACPPGGCGGFHLTSREEFDEDIRNLRSEQYLEQTKNRRIAEIQREQGSR